MVLSSPHSDNRSTVSVGLALAALRSGNVLQARQMLQDRLAQHPADADALQLLSEIAVSQRSIEEATILLRRAVAADPSPERRLALVDHLRSNAGPAIALAELEKLPQVVRDDFEIRGLEANLLGILGMHERQIQVYQAMAREQPASAGLWVSLGNALKTVGRTAEAVKALQRAIKAKPAHGESYWTLANFKSFHFSPRDISQMRQVLSRRLNDEDALHIHFALGKAFEDRGDYESSFRHYAEGNAIRAATLPLGKGSISDFVDTAIAACTPEFFERNRNSGCPAEGPIFVVGMHRAGSTLIEQILASHSMVEGTTELPVMTSIRERIGRGAGGASSAAAIASLKPDDFRAIGEEYLERTRPFRHTDRPYFVDKMPSNWMNVALIRAALPNARVIDARRHPMACGFSNFKQNYAAGLGFSYSLEGIGLYYRDYWRFMRHFDEVQPGAVHRVVNERLIEESETQIRMMLNYLGLPFESSCLEFHKNERAVRTPSAEQVRRPINREGVDYWRHYEPWLDEMKRALGPALDSWAN